MDATHLAEFFQVEGVVADYDITLGNLIGGSPHFLSAFFIRLSPLRADHPSVHAGILRKDGKHKVEVQACFQPIHRGPQVPSSPQTFADHLTSQVWKSSLTTKVWASGSKLPMCVHPCPGIRQRECS